MAGIEVAGLVLGAFPIIVKCLGEYRRGFETVEGWWKFRTDFIVLVDDIQHQMMTFHGSIVSLLDPIIPQNKVILELAANGADPRWRDESLATALQKRLAGDLDRLLRTICRIHEIVEQLKALLQIKDGQIPWTGTSLENPPWQLHLKRFHVAFRKDTYNQKVRKLQEQNQVLTEILGHSNRMLSIDSRRRTGSDATTRLEKVRQNTLGLFNALSRVWSCSGCQEHEANLRIHHNATDYELEMLLVVRGEAQGPSASLFRPYRVTARRELGSNAATSTDIREVPHASVFSEMQQVIEWQLSNKATRPTFQQRISNTLKHKGSSSLTSAMKKHFGGSSSTPRTSLSFSSVVAVDGQNSSGPGTEGHAGPDIPPQAMALSMLPLPVVATCSIQSLCTFLGDASQLKGTLSDGFDRLFELQKGSAVPDNNRTTRLSLYEMLEAYQENPPALDLPRQTRFEMAAHIASALLQTNQSPWVLGDWSGDKFYFVVDPVARKLQSSHAFVSRSFPAPAADVDTQLSEETVQHCLRSVGIMIMELVFGCSIERSGAFTTRGGDASVDKQAYITAAKHWHRRLEPESGYEVAAAVKKCLYEGGFVRAACFSNSEFRKEVYQQVVEPLVNYKESWILETED